MPRGVRGAGCGVAAVLRGAGGSLLPARPPCGFLSSPGAGGTPLRLSQRDPPSPAGRPTWGRSGIRGAGRSGRFAPGPPSLAPAALRPSFLLLLFLLSPLCVSKSPGSPTAAPGPDPALSLTAVPAPSCPPTPLPPSTMLQAPRFQALPPPLRPGWQWHRVPGDQVATGAGVAAGAGFRDADGPAGSSAHPAG